MLQSGEAPFPFLLFPLMFILIPVALIAFGLALAIAVAVTGYLIRQRQRYLFCLVIGAIETIFMPFGTVLGVFTVILLTRPAIKGLFQS